VINEPMLERDEPCERCQGKGTYWGGPRGDSKIMCSDCAGSGHAPTEFGAAVLEFVKRHLLPED
jgi:DnaJ-class molecular chaperone